MSSKVGNEIILPFLIFEDTAVENGQIISSHTL